MGELYNASISVSEKESFWKKIVDSEEVDASEVVKQCCSVDGIPEKCRKAAWRFLLSKQIEEEVSSNLGAYDELAATDDSELKDVIADIDADLKNCHIEDEDRLQSVRNIHKAYLLYDKNNVFVPGVSTLLNFLLDYFTEQELFNVYNVLYHRVWPEGSQFDTRGYLVEERVVKSLLFEKDPQIIMHINNTGMSIDKILLTWMITFYANAVSTELSKYFFDTYFCTVYCGEGKIGFSTETFYFASVVSLLRAVSEPFLNETDGAKADKALHKALKALTTEQMKKVVVDARELSRDIPSYKISAFREKHEMACKGEMENRDRNLWSGSEVTFKEGALGLTLKSTKKMLTLGRYRRNPDGTPGAAEESGVLVPGVVLVSIDEDAVEEGLSVGKASKKIKQLKEENGQVVLKFQLLSALEQKKEEESSKKSNYVSDDYMPDYLEIGEKIVKNVELSVRVPDVVGSFYLPAFEMHKGRMFITTYRLIFHPYMRLKKAKKSKTPKSPKSPTSAETPIAEEESGELVEGPLGTTDMQIPLLKIEQIMESGPRSLCMTLKDKMVVNMFFSSSKGMDGFVQETRRYGSPTRSDEVFAFRPEASKLIPQGELNGWTLYDAALDYDRVGLLNCPKLRLYVQGYDTNPTYPSRFLIPADFSDEDFQVICKYRSKARVPVPVWRHPTTNAVLCRSAQPMVGLKLKRSSMDEKLIRKLMSCCGASAKRYYFVDARSYIAAMGNQSMGKGTENPANYPGSEIFFMNIANIHAARESMQKMSDLFNPDVYKGDDDNFFRMLADAKWYEQVRTILCAIARSVEMLEDNGCSILSHCSDGWDRTAQMVAGTELMLDPYYRTLVGFEILIEKEWCSFGHQFRRRFGQDNTNANDDQRSPVFILWLDCVYQAMQQFPTAFEFNEDLLLCINEHVYSGRFGTFLFDCEAKRFEFQAKERTVSLWSYINDPSRIESFKNPNYVRCETSLRLDSTSKHLRIWRNMWDRYDPSVTPKKERKYYCWSVCLSTRGGDGEGILARKIVDGITAVGQIMNLGKIRNLLLDW